MEGLQKQVHWSESVKVSKNKERQLGIYIVAHAPMDDAEGEYRQTDDEATLPYTWVRRDFVEQMYTSHKITGGAHFSNLNGYVFVAVRKALHGLAVFLKWFYWSYLAKIWVVATALLWFIVFLSAIG